jgi:hypothetical protein
MLVARAPKDLGGQVKLLMPEKLLTESDIEEFLLSCATCILDVLPEFLHFRWGCGGF